MIDVKWEVRYKDRGHGFGDEDVHCDFAITTVDGEIVVGPISRELAEHIVELHNGKIKTSNSRKTRAKDAKGEGNRAGRTRFC